MIIAYIVIHRLELEHPADRNRQELTLELLLLFFLGALAVIAVTIAFKMFVFLKERRAFSFLSHTTVDNMYVGVPLSVFLPSAILLIVRACSTLWQAWVLNDDLSE